MRPVTCLVGLLLATGCERGGEGHVVSGVMLQNVGGAYTMCQVVGPAAACAPTTKALYEAVAVRQGGEVAKALLQDRDCSILQAEATSIICTRGDEITALRMSAEGRYRGDLVVSLTDFDYPPSTEGLLIPIPIKLCGLLWRHHDLLGAVEKYHDWGARAQMSAHRVCPANWEAAMADDVPAQQEFD